MPAGAAPKTALLHEDGTVLKQCVDRMDRRVFSGKPASGTAVVSDELKQHIRDLYPMLLDGMLVSNRQEMGVNTLRTLSNLASQPFSSEFSGERLREMLDTVTTPSRPKTKAGIVPVSPRRMRAWWDRDLLSGAIDGIHEADRPRGVLRFYDITGLSAESDSWNQLFDIDADFAESGKTIDFWAADKTYRIELGLVFADSRFVRLAKLPCCSLPREAPGHAGVRFVRSNLDLSGSAKDAFIPDDDAWQWFLSGSDWPLRDQNAELILRMVYREFLREGPRVLRKLPDLVMPTLHELERQYQKRSRLAVHKDYSRSPLSTAKSGGRQVLVALLDASPLTAARTAIYPVAVAGKTILSSLLGSAFPYHQYYDTLLRLAVGQPVQRVNNDPAVDAVVLPEKEVTTATEETAPDISHLVQHAPAGMRESFAWRTASLLEASKGLTRDLSQLSDVTPEKIVPSIQAHKEMPNRLDSKEVVALGTSPDIGGAEGRRFAKAGIALSRMAVSLEGRVRPGAKFKVAGKYITADRNGRFRVECVLSGKNIRIPMQVDNGRTGLARGLLRIEWDKTGKKKERIEA